MKRRDEREPTGFKDRLRALRGEESQERLAARAGISAGTVAKIEQGKVEPSWGTVLALADALGVSTEAFRPALPPE